MPESYNGDEGNEAQGAGLDVMDGGEKVRGTDGGWRAINKTRDMVVWALNQAKTYADDLFASISLSWANITGKPSTFPPSAHTHPSLLAGSATFGWNGVDRWNSSGGFGASGIIATAGDMVAQGLTAATSNWVAMYHDGTGRLCRGVPSALKYKRDITDYDGSVLPLRVVTYVLDDDPTGEIRLGVIADDADTIEPLLVIRDNGEIESFRYELLAVALLRDVQRLAAEVEQLKAGAS